MSRFEFLSCLTPSNKINFMTRFDLKIWKYRVEKQTEKRWFVLYKYYVKKKDLHNNYCSICLSSLLPFSPHFLDSFYRKRVPKCPCQRTYDFIFWSASITTWMVEILFCTGVSKQSGLPNSLHNVSVLFSCWNDRKIVPSFLNTTR